MLLVALDRAVENGSQVLIAVSADGSVLRALDLMGFDQVLQIFPSLQEALADWPVAGSVTSHPRLRQLDGVTMAES